MESLFTKIFMTIMNLMVSQTVFSAGFKNNSMMLAASIAKVMQYYLWAWNFEIWKEFHYSDYHYWYEDFDEKKDRDLFLGFELKDNAVSRYEPVGIIWNDSFCRNLGIWFHRFPNCRYVINTAMDTGSALKKEPINHIKSVMANLAVTLKIKMRS